MLAVLSGRSVGQDRSCDPGTAPRIATPQSTLPESQNRPSELAPARARGQPEPLGGLAGIDDPARAQRFRDAALPYLDDVYTFARYLLRDSADAEDAAQECYMRALRHFDSYRGPAMKPWLFAILRNVCRAEMARRAGAAIAVDEEAETDNESTPLWQEAPASPEAEMIRQWDAETIHRLVADLPTAFREAIVLREINELSYREIAEVAGVPVGTIMSRLARARCMLREAWIAEDGPRT
jgi:RNA polymerase sigma-70 factor (ECF subfamily)